MNYFNQTCLAILLLIMASFNLQAGEPTKSSVGAKAFKTKLAELYPQLGVEAASATAVPNIFQVELVSGELIYVSADYQHLFSGDLMRIEETGIVNLSEQWRGKKRIDAINGVDDKDLVVFPATGEERAEILVFTDVSCGYCRKFHSEVPQLNKQGITVKYAAWPRHGLNSPSGQTMVNVWCAAEPTVAMTNAKINNQPVEAPAGKTCDQNVVQDQINLGRTMGIRGTPAVFATDGRQLGGYVPADKLVSQLISN